MNTTGLLTIKDSCRLRLCALALTATLLLTPAGAFAQLRPLVPPMLDNLSAIDRIGDWVALEEYHLVEGTARDLMKRAEEMKSIDLATVGIDPQRDALWDAFLQAQQAAAAGVLAAAQKKDPRATLVATQQLMGNACLGCHLSFRDPARLLRVSVRVMTSFLAIWRDVNRGVAINDYNLIETRARDLSSLTGMISSDEMLEDTFGLGGPKQRRLFRGYLREVTLSAERIEEAAKQENLVAVLDASRNMWTAGCISCHEEFRR